MNYNFAYLTNCFTKRHLLWFDLSNVPYKVENELLYFIWNKSQKDLEAVFNDEEFSQLGLIGTIFNNSLTIEDVINKARGR